MTLGETVKRGFLTGLVLVAPLAITIVVIQVAYAWLIGAILPLVRLLPLEGQPLAPPVALGLVFVAVTLLGVTVRRGVGETAVLRFDQLMESIPGVRAIYGSVREASTALADHESRFERVAIVDLDDGLHTLGFVTDESPADVATAMESDGTVYSVFVPMAPNPMGGFLLLVEERNLTMTELSVGEGLQTVLTTGMAGDHEFDPSEVAGERT